jgi:C1A family cysteine protease
MAFSAGTALRFRNNWGTAWGEDGYGWLPYEHLLRSIARHTWMVLESPWSHLRAP